MVQHPPLFYYLTAATTSVAQGADARWDSAHLAMRGVSTACIALSVPFIAGVARRLSSRRTVGALAASAPAFVPFFSTSSGYVSNDSLLTLTISATAYFGIRGAQGPFAPIRFPVLSGIFYGLALLTKGFALFFGPAFVILLTLGFLHQRPARLHAFLTRVALPGLIAAVIGGWWWVRNLVLLGTLQPSQLGSREPQDQPHEDYDLIVFLENAWSRLTATFWGRGARDAVALPEAAVAFATAAAIIALVVACFTLRRQVAWWALLIYPVAILGTTLQNAHEIFYDLGDPSRGVQGRYLFSAIVVFCVAVAISQWHVLRALKEKPATLAYALAALGPWVVALIAFHYVQTRTWLAMTDLLESVGVGSEEWMGVQTGTRLVLSILVGLGALALAVLTPRISEEDLSRRIDSQA